MALHATALIDDLTELKEVLKIPGNQDDANLEMLVNGITAKFETVTERMLRKRTLTDYRINGNGLMEILLPWVPVQSVTKVEIRNTADDSVQAVVTDTSKFILKDKKLGLLTMKENVLVCGLKNILVTMEVGFNLTDMEFADCKTYLFKQLAFEYRLLRNNELGLQTRTFQDGSISFVPPVALLKEVEDGLRYWKDWYYA